MLKIILYSYAKGVYSSSAGKDKLRSRDWIEARLKEESDAIDKALEKARLTDEEEDQLYGVDKRGDELPEELRDPVKRREKLRQRMDNKAQIGRKPRRLVAGFLMELLDTLLWERVV